MNKRTYSTNTSPLVTVLMAVYNGGNYLKHSIESILSQTYKDFEFLIVNDCSTDNSMETIESFKDERIIVHSNKVNLGQTRSLNVGLKLSKGKYIVINDADDLSLPQRIEKQLDFILKHPQYVVVGASSFIMDQKGKIWRTFLKPTDSFEILFAVLTDNPLIHGSVIMEREIILANGGYNEDFRICQDYELWSSLLRKGFRIANMADILVVIRHYMDSISFKENTAQTLEHGKVLYENIRGLGGIEISPEEGLRQRIFFMAPEHLDKDEFARAEQLFLKAYKNIRKRVVVENHPNQRNLKKKLMKPYAKLALAQFNNGQFKEARKIAYHFLRVYGFSLVPFAIWIVSHFGKKGLKRTLHIHEKWQKLSATFCRWSH
jgi:glycosyltransferase involved in cell wall biosynthesis